MTAVRNPFTGKFTRLTPALVAPVVTRNHKLEVQRITIAKRVEKIGPDRERIARARKNGLRGPLTRADLARLVK